MNWKRKQTNAGWLMAELAIAATLIVLVMVPLGYTFHREQKLARVLYQRAILVQIVDGEAALLRAGEWKNLKQGENTLNTRAEAAKNLEQGTLIATRDSSRITVEWRPATVTGTTRIERKFSIDEDVAAP